MNPAPMEVMNELRFRGTPDRGWYEPLDSSKIPPECSCARREILPHEAEYLHSLSAFTTFGYLQHLIRLPNENTGGGAYVLRERPRVRNALGRDGQCHNEAGANRNRKHCYHYWSIWRTGVFADSTFRGGKSEQGWPLCIRMVSLCHLIQSYVLISPVRSRPTGPEVL
jgi:hypothetical protein